MLLLVVLMMRLLKLSKLKIIMERIFISLCTMLLVSSSMLVLWTTIPLSTGQILFILSNRRIKNMTKHGIKKMITDFGDRIFAINFDNSQIAFFGYKDTYKITDVELQTIGGVDYLVIHNKDHQSMGTTKMDYDIYHSVDTVQFIGVMDTDSAD